MNAIHPYGCLHQNRNNDPNGARDFIVPDVHGCYQQLITALVHLDFNFSRDRVWFLGDMVDRGPEVMDLIKLYMSQDNFFRNDNFHMVLGNHEAMLIEGITSSCGGGKWVKEVTEEQKPLLEDFINELQTTPFTIHLDSQGQSHFLAHAEVPMPWHGYNVDWHTVYHYNYSTRVTWSYECDVIWGRTMIHDKDFVFPLTDYVFHGHTILEHPIQLGNRVYLDTGFYYGSTKGVGSLSIYETGTKVVRQIFVDFKKLEVIKEDQFRLDTPDILKV